MGEVVHVSLLPGYDNSSSSRGKLLKKGEKRQWNVNNRSLVPAADVPQSRNLAKISAARTGKLRLSNHRTIPGNKRGQVKMAVFKSVITGAQTVFSSAVEGLRSLLNNETIGR